MKEKNKKESDNKKNIILICIFILLVLASITLLSISKSSSKLDSEEEVMAYLKKMFGDDNFEVSNKTKLDEKVCNNVGYSWTVKSNKSGVTFEVYESAFIKYNTQECVTSTTNNYEDKILDIFYENEKIESDNKYNYIFYPNDYNSKEELANKIYGLIDKYYLKKYPYSINLIIKVDGTNVPVMPENINSPEDIINNYLGK